MTVLTVANQVTLLRMLLGLVRPDAGTAVVDGVAVPGIPRRPPEFSWP